ncbi:MAG: response regulator transcription factor [Roseicyclus sp.]
MTHVVSAQAATPDFGPTAKPQIVIIEDDAAMRESLVWLVESVGHETVAYPSADAFLAEARLPCIGCVVTDMRMPGTSGLGLIEKLRARKSLLPVVVITAFASVRDAVTAMQLGAVDFLEKPFHDQDLLDLLNDAVARTRDSARACCRARAAAQRLDALTTRELEVVRVMARGLRNKEIARELDISPKTVEIHRQRALAKLGVDSAVELHRLLAAATDAAPCSVWPGLS